MSKSEETSPNDQIRSVKEMSGETGEPVESNVDFDLIKEIRELRRGQERLELLFTKELQRLKDEIQEDLNRRFENFSSTVQTQINIIGEEVSSLENRISDMETNISTQNSHQFDTETTIVATGIRYTEGENILKKCQELIRDGIGSDIKVKNAKRTPFRENKPGAVVKIEFENKEDKINVLKQKKNLANSVYKKVFIRSSQTHAERLMQLNTMTLLKELGKDNKFRILGNGKLVEKNNPEA